MEVCETEDIDEVSYDEEMALAREEEEDVVSSLVIFTFFFGGTSKPLISLELTSFSRRRFGGKECEFTTSLVFVFKISLSFPFPLAETEADTSLSLPCPDMGAPFADNGLGAPRWAFRAGFIRLTTVTVTRGALEAIEGAEDDFDFVLLLVLVESCLTKDLELETVDEGVSALARDVNA